TVPYRILSSSRRPICHRWPPSYPLSAAGRASLLRRRREASTGLPRPDRSCILEELPLKVVRIAERDYRWTQRICLDTAVRHSRPVKHRGRPGPLADRNANSQVVQADPVLGKPVIGRGTRQRRYQHQPRGRPVEPQSQLHAGEVLVNPETEDAFVERSGTLQV